MKDDEINYRDYISETSDSSGEEGSDCIISDDCKTNVNNHKTIDH